MTNSSISKDQFLLSVFIPVYNEKETIQEVINRVIYAPYRKEIILVDDGSTDGTRDILNGLNNPALKICYHDKNYGKGRALQTSFATASGDIIVVQDADLEYDPSEYPVILNPILSGKADVVYGSRLSGHGEHRVLYFWHYMGNRFLTLLSNIFTNLNLTDMETCYKAFTHQALEGIAIQESRFGFEPEITAKIAKKICGYTRFRSVIMVGLMPRGKRSTGVMACGLCGVLSSTI